MKLTRTIMALLMASALIFAGCDSDSDDNTPAACDADNPCADGFTCTDGECVADAPACDADNPCADGFTCTDGECVADAPACDADNPCEDGFTCTDGVCVADAPACDADNPCEDGFTCTDGVCVADGGDTYATIVFKADDSANGVYGDADLEWKGSFTYDAENNEMIFDAAWGGGNGPYIPLYDDGPISEGGHEAEGETAGDNILTCAVMLKTNNFDDAGEPIDLTIEYGLQTAAGDWVWTGDGNGQLVVPHGSTDVIEAPGQVFEAFGTIDLKLVIDTAALDAGFLPFDGTTTELKVKGTMSSWAEILLVDDGTKGDEAADDGIYTFVLSENLGEGMGLLKMDEVVEFVYVVGMVEYKDANGDALPTGVTAASTYETEGTWSDETVEMVTGGMGGQNTAVIIGE